MTFNLKDIVARIRETADNVSSVAGRVGGISKEVLEGSKAQSNDIETTLSSMTEVSSSVKGISQKISKLSKFDCKTSLANRQYFLEQLEFALASASDINKNVLIDITVDNVKAIISNSGLEWTDDLNQQIVENLTLH